jgi:light-independent protochlorophyllide reductase subunit B
MSSSQVEWDEEAERRLRKVPFFVRPLVRMRAERTARERGLERVTAALLAELRSSAHTDR